MSKKLPSLSILEAREYIREHEGEYGVVIDEADFEPPPYPCPNILSIIREQTARDLLLVQQPNQETIAILNPDISILEKRERDFLVYFSNESRGLRNRCTAAMFKLHEIHGADVVAEVQSHLTTLVGIEVMIMRQRYILDRDIFALAISEDVIDDDVMEDYEQSADVFFEAMYERLEVVELSVGLPHLSE